MNPLVRAAYSSQPSRSARYFSRKTPQPHAGVALKEPIFAMVDPRRRSLGGPGFRGTSGRGRSARSQQESQRSVGPARCPQASSRPGSRSQSRVCPAQSRSAAAVALVVARQNRHRDDAEHQD